MPRICVVRRSICSAGGESLEPDKVVRVKKEWFEWQCIHNPEDHFRPEDGSLPVWIDKSRKCRYCQ